MVVNHYKQVILFDHQQHATLFTSLMLLHLTKEYFHFETGKS